MTGVPRNAFSRQFSLLSQPSQRGSKRDCVTTFQFSFPGRGGAGVSCRSTGDQETSHMRPFRRRDTSFHQRSQPQAAKRWQAFWQNAELSVEFASILTA